jgi:hypothetical protein
VKPQVRAWLTAPAVGKVDEAHLLDTGQLAINNIALQALVAAYAAHKTIADEASARIAVTEVTSD